MVTLPRCRSHWTFGKHMKPQPVVDEDWMPIVWGLMDLNMYYSSVDGVQTLKFDRPDKSSVVLSPAIAAVLFTFLGGQAAIEASWESKDHVAALFALRQLALEGVRSCRRDGDVPRFKSTLSELEIVKTVYGSGLRSGSPTETTFQIPCCSNSTVWLNGHVHPYASVVAPRVLYLSKPTKVDSNDIYLMDELLKCGLLNDDFIDRQEESVQNRAHFGSTVTRRVSEMWNWAPAEAHCVQKQNKNHAHILNARWVAVIR
jgi:hypothetical protein